jgi:hypothetical protein
MEVVDNTQVTKLVLNMVQDIVMLSVQKISSISMERLIFLTGRLQDPLLVLESMDLVALRWIFGKPTLFQKLILPILAALEDQKDVKTQLIAELLIDMEAGAIWMVVILTHTELESKTFLDQE